MIDLKNIFKQVCIIGHFGGNEKFNDGQTIKTITFLQALESRNITVNQADTYYAKRKPFVFMFQLLMSFFTSKKIVIMVSDNGVRILFPILSFLHKITKKQIFHYAIGGDWGERFQKTPKLSVYLNSFEENWVESRNMIAEWQKNGVQNAIYIPNFKKLKCLDPTNLPLPKKHPFQFCIFSRILKEKGVEDAMAAIKQINQNYGEGTAVLDIYGAIDKNYEKEFEAKLKEYADCCYYKGVVAPNDSVDVLKQYYMLLFPTHYRTEGIPGTIIDAFSSGLPVIARQWNCCNEMVEDHKTGYVYDFDQPDELFSKIEYAVEHPAQTIDMKKNCLTKAKEYSEDIVMTSILNKLFDS